MLVRKVIARAGYGVALALLTPVFRVEPVQAQELIALPSGLDVRVQEVIFEENPDVARFRFVAPELGTDGRGYEEVHGDFPWLCQEMILPTLTETQKAGDVVISIADREVTFGEFTPEATQYFELFHVVDDICMSESF